MRVRVRVGNCHGVLLVVRNFQSWSVICLPRYFFSLDGFSNVRGEESFEMDGLEGVL